MTVQECYAHMNGDYEDTIGRLMSDDRIVKYLNKFAAGDDYNSLLTALSEKRYEDAFRHAHNLKGMSLNLGITALAKSGSEVCEALRGGAPTVDIEPMLAVLKQDYENTMAAISQL